MVMEPIFKVIGMGEFYLGQESLTSMVLEQENLP
jgi:hypothetical protein